MQLYLTTVLIDSHSPNGYPDYYVVYANGLGQASRLTWQHCGLAPDFVELFNEQHPLWQDYQKPELDAVFQRINLP